MIRRHVLKSAAMALALCLTGPAMAQGPVDDNVLVIEIQDSVNGVIEIELLPQIAPQHVERIKILARTGAYDNVAFHRVIDGFMAQTGDVKYGTRDAFGEGRAGFGGSDLPDIPAEFSDENFAAGVVGMARAQDPNSANSQFFIMLAEGAFLNNNYTVFGRVISGMEHVEAIRKGDANGNGVVAEPDFMHKVTIKGDTN